MLFRSDPDCLKREAAVEEAICFGWIDGLLRKTGASTYTLYFTKRRPKSNWSPKNIATAIRLEAEGRLMEAGRDKIAEAKANGAWDNPAALPPYDPEQTQILIDALSNSQLARENLLKMSLSVQRTYTMMFLDAKTEAGRKRRLERIISRLEQNLKPM